MVFVFAETVVPSFMAVVQSGDVDRLQVYY